MSEIKHDAKSRAFRTFIQGLGVDVVLIASIVLYNATSSNDFSWNGTYWTGIGLLIARNVLHSVSSYVMRYFKSPPQN